jgi:hypothetical protein
MSIWPHLITLLDQQFFSSFISFLFLFGKEEEKGGEGGEERGE